jgi:hypothetical protein
MKRTVVAFLLAPLWVPAAEVIYTAHRIPFLKPRHLVILTILWAIFAYGGALILGLPAFYLLGFFGVRNRTSFWLTIALGFGIAVLTVIGFSAFFFGLFAPDFSIGFVFNQWTHLSLWLDALPIGVLGSIVAGTLWLIARPDRRHA